MKIIGTYSGQSIAYPGETLKMTLADFSDTDPTDKIRMARHLITLGAADPLINQLAHAIVQNVPARDTAAQSQAILSYVQEHITYVDDGTQVFREAAYTATHPSGNCLSAGAILFGSLAESITIPVRLKVLSHRTGLFKLESFHIFPEVLINGIWVPAEPTQPWELGRDPAAYAELHADEL